MTSDKKHIREYAAEYGLIGYPLGHSFSKDFFNKKFESEGIDARYINFELPDIGDLMEAVAEHPRLRGLNVTIPYKEQIIPYLDYINPVAEEIGAVNVVKIDRGESGKELFFEGYNSDMVGFSDSIYPLLQPWHTDALVLGTGGASKAVTVGLQRLGLNTQLVSRSEGAGRITYSDLTQEVMDRYKVIVNTTPLGMYPNVDSCPDIPYDLLTPEHLCYDLIYNPDITEFMKRSEAQGATVKNGLEMLLLQAFESWRIWNNSNNRE